MADHRSSFSKTCSIQVLVKEYTDGKSISTAGRLIAKRGHGKLVFADLRDASGKIQLCIKRDHIQGDTWTLFNSCTLGDILGVTGTLFKTQTGEVTIKADDVCVLAKAYRALPEKWHGLKDVEIRYRKRYLDLIVNEPVRRTFVQRSRLITNLRDNLQRNGFLEVETPMMHPIPGGAAGEPFVTRHNALGTDFYLRLAPELYLKKLLVGGLERVYEINRSFRNEGLSTRHNPEFTMLEAYVSYHDYTFWMEYLEEMISEAAKELLGTTTFKYQGNIVDLTPPWERVSFAQAMSDIDLAPNAPIEKIKRVLRKHDLNLSGLSRSQLVNLVEQIFSPKTKAKPMFVVDYWTELSPLARSKPDDPDIAERFELFMGGMELANAYSELNDPIEQRLRFEAQAKGLGKDLIDESFVEALEYGMPPATGMGLGIDRLAMVLLDQPSIKDVILFPTLKPERHRSKK